MDLIFFTLICCKNCIDVCLKRPKIIEKEVGLAIFFFKKVISSEILVLVGPLTVLLSPLLKMEGFEVERSKINVLCTRLMFCVREGTKRLCLCCGKCLRVL